MAYPQGLHFNHLERGPGVGGLCYPGPHCDSDPGWGWPHTQLSTISLTLQETEFSLVQLKISFIKWKGWIERKGMGRVRERRGEERWWTLLALLLGTWGSILLALLKSTLSSHLRIFRHFLFVSSPVGWKFPGWWILFCSLAAVRFRGGLVAERNSMCHWCESELATAYLGQLW